MSGNNREHDEKKGCKLKTEERERERGLSGKNGDIWGGERHRRRDDNERERG